MQYHFLEISVNKNTEHLTLILIMQCNCHKVYENYIKFNSTQCKKPRKTKASFIKELVENADLHKPLYDKIMTTYE